jgi:hypothetical protein
MSRLALAWVTLSLITMAGCRICSSPYDNCSPTFTGQCGEDCAPFARAGSILSGYFPPMPDEGYVPDQVSKLPDVEGPASKIAMSATEEEVEVAPPEETVVVKQRRPQAQGWTAAKRDEPPLR